MTSLKNVLMINAASSGLTGLILTFLSGFVAGLFDVTNRIPFVGVGIFLLAFAFFVFITSLQNPMRESTVIIIVWMDALWVIVSAGIVALQPFDMKPIGYILIAAVACWVMLMAYLQYHGTKQLSHPKH